MYAFFSAEIEAISQTCQAMLSFEPAVLAGKGLLITLVIAAVVKTLASLLQSKFFIEKIDSSLITKIKIHNHEVSIFSSETMEAFLAGIPFVSSKIYVSSKLASALTDKELEAVVLHEQFHYRQFHLVKEFLFSVITDVFFFLPSLKDIQYHWQVKTELAADAFAQTSQGSDLYLKSALATVLSENPRTCRAATVPAIHFARSVIEQRVNVLTQTPSKTLPIKEGLHLAISLVVILGLIFLRNAAPVEATVPMPGSQCQQIWESTTPQRSEAFISPAS